MTELTGGPARKTTLVACPTRDCKTKHLVDSAVTEVFIVDDNGRSTPYNWKDVQQLNRVD